MGVRKPVAPAWRVSANRVAEDSVQHLLGDLVSVWARLGPPGLGFGNAIFAQIRSSLCALNRGLDYLSRDDLVALCMWGDGPVPKGFRSESRLLI